MNVKAKQVEGGVGVDATDVSLQYRATGYETNTCAVSLKDLSRSISASTRSNPAPCSFLLLFFTFKV